MPEYRRPWIAGATYFITIVTYRRRKLFVNEPRIDQWRGALAAAKATKPFDVLAGVILHDHMHLMLSLPRGDRDISTRIGHAKAIFTKSIGGGRSTSSASRRIHRESDVWQRRFFDHAIRDEDDFIAHMNYLHYNPVKHGYVECPKDWAWSSFAHWVRIGAYQRDWGCPRLGPPPDFSEIEDHVGE